jgi:hypothetical protein
VHNAAVNTLRSAPERKLTFVDLDSHSLEGAVTESVLEQRLAAREALTDVASLPPMQREAILMSAVDGRSHDEVAGALGITSGAVRGLLYRARATLRGAAAALVPPPLVMWASRSGGVVSPAAISLGRLSGSSTGELGSMLAKGAVLAAGAAVAAGAVLVPHHTRPYRALDNDHASVASVSPGVAATGGLVPGQPAGRDHSSHRAAARSRAPGGPSRAAPAMIGPSATTGAEGLALAHRRPIASTHPKAPSAPIVSSAPSTPVGVAPSSTTAPTVAGHVAESAPAHIAEAPASTTPTKPEGPAGGSSPPPQGGSEETKTSGGQAEREAEEARVRKEHEEQEARERKEREADDNGGSDDGGERLGTDD